MADIGAIKAELAAFEGQQKAGLVSAFTYLLRNLSFGAVEHQRPATNFQAYYLNGVTSSNANAEFSIPHGLNGAPSVVIPVLGLDQVGAQLVPLRVSRVADNRRIYLSSPTTSAAISVLVGA